MLRSITGRPGPSGFGSATTAEQVTHGIDGSNLTAIVTGGASGIGLETAGVLAMRNVHVIIAERNMEAANEAKQRILKDNKAARVDVERLDLSSIRSVKAFADNFKELNLPLNILINNAGVMYCPFQLSEDGIEMQFATNHIGHFYLTNLLLDKMKETAKSTGIQGRIVNLSSLAHLFTYKEGIRFDKINDKNSYHDKRAYFQSKLANILHANELSRRLQEEGANITVNSVHPGLIMTNLMKHTALLMSIIKTFSSFMWKNVPQGPEKDCTPKGPILMQATVAAFMARTSDLLETTLLLLRGSPPISSGAATTCYVALHPSLNGVTGKFFNDCNEQEPSKLAQDEDLARNLWDFSNNVIDAALKT